jgi:hypothetical protein
MFFVALKQFSISWLNLLKQPPSWLVDFTAGFMPVVAAFRMIPTMSTLLGDIPTCVTKKESSLIIIQHFEPLLTSIKSY